MGTWFLPVGMGAVRPASRKEIHPLTATLLPAAPELTKDGPGSER